MKQLICCSGSQINQLYDVIKNVRDETVVLASAGSYDGSDTRRLEAAGIKFIAYDEAEKAELWHKIGGGVERCYFVVSDPPMSSSAYQAMIYSLGPWIVHFECWKITLEEAVIPRGFAFLRHLPEGAPALNTAPRGGQWWRSLRERWTRRPAGLPKPPIQSNRRP